MPVRYVLVRMRVSELHYGNSWLTRTTLSTRSARWRRTPLSSRKPSRLRGLRKTSVVEACQIALQESISELTKGPRAPVPQTQTKYSVNSPTPDAPAPQVVTETVEASAKGRFAANSETAILAMPAPQIALTIVEATQTTMPEAQRRVGRLWSEDCYNLTTSGLVVQRDCMLGVCALKVEGHVQAEHL